MIAGPGGLAEIECLLSSIDVLRRSLAGGIAPQAEIYLESARGNLLHVREALLNYRRRASQGAAELNGGGVVELMSDRPLCRMVFPAGWMDEAHYECPDLGADLIDSADARSSASKWHSGGMLLAALADHAWLHLGSGASWSTDRSGALALVGAMNGGRAVARYDVERLAGTLEESTVRMIAQLGWRRLRSPRWEPS